eukprot:COSAG04_NODE_5381_length_1636_cov_1.566688_3_plen_101_part_01
MVETGFKDNALDNLGEGADEEALAQTDVSSQWCSRMLARYTAVSPGCVPHTGSAVCSRHLGLSPAELVDLLAEGIEQGIFYIRACAHPCPPCSTRPPLPLL